MQFWAMQIRISEYGLTSARYLSIYANSLAAVFALLTIIKRGQYLKYVFILAMLGCVFAFIIPRTNAINAPAIDQQNRLVALLEKHNMLDVNGKIIKNDNIPQEDKTAIISSYRYLRYFTHDSKYVDKVNLDINEVDLFGAFYPSEQNRSTMLFISYHDDSITNGAFNIAGFSTIEVFQGGEDYVNGFEPGLKKAFIDFYNQNPASGYSNPFNFIYDFKDGSRVVLSHLELKITEENGEKNINVSSVYGYLLRK
jgi:hypothetical protein